MALLNEYERTLHFVESQVVGQISMTLNKIETWKNLDVKVYCTLAKRDYIRQYHPAAQDGEEEVHQFFSRNSENNVSSNRQWHRSYS